jgi:hypothetical protein
MNLRARTILIGIAVATLVVLGWGVRTYWRDAQEFQEWQLMLLASVGPPVLWHGSEVIYRTDFYGTYHANTFRTIEACEDWRTERLNDAPTARLICQPRYAWYRLVWAEYQRRMKQRQTAGAAR